MSWLIIYILIRLFVCKFFGERYEDKISLVGFDSSCLNHEPYMSMTVFNYCMDQCFQAPTIK